MAWWESFLGYSLKHLPHVFSDYCTILVDLGDVSRGSTIWGKRGFRFNANWILEDCCEQQVRIFGEVNIDDVPTKLEKLGKVLKNEMGGISSNKRLTSIALNMRLANMSSADLDYETLAELEEVKLALNLEANKEELFWEQRARANWLPFGD